MKTENLTRYTCDLCKKTEYLGKNDANPMQQYRLPMKYYDECGRDHGMTNQQVDLCADCLRELGRVLSEHYDMCCIAYVGVRMKRRATVERAE